MAVLKKRRTTHGKASRQQQQQQQQQLRAKQRFENSRLKPEQVSSIVHDESDTLSYRSYLMINFVKSAEFIDVLMTQPVSNSQIRPPTIFGRLNAQSLDEKLSSEKEQLRLLKEATDNFSWNLSEDSQFFKDKLREALNSGKNGTPEIMRDYLERFQLRSQNDRIVFHRNKFNHLRADTSEAPSDYWEKHTQLKREQREKALALQKKKEHEEAQKEKIRLEEEVKRKLAMDEERRKKEEEQKQQERMHLQLQMQQDQDSVKPLGHVELPQQPAHQLPDLLQAQAKSHLTNPLDVSEGQTGSQAQISQQMLQQNDEQDEPNEQDEQDEQNPPQIPTQNGIDSIFGDFGNEPFNSGFDDEFGELDTAFF